MFPITLTSFNLVKDDYHSEYLAYRTILYDVEVLLLKIQIRRSKNTIVSLTTCYTYSKVYWRDYIPLVFPTVPAIYITSDDLIVLK